MWQRGVRRWVQALGMCAVMTVSRVGSAQVDAVTLPGATTSDPPSYQFLEHTPMWPCARPGEKTAAQAAGETRLAPRAQFRVVSRGDGQAMIRFLDWTDDQQKQETFVEHWGPSVLVLRGALDEYPRA